MDKNTIVKLPGMEAFIEANTHFHRHIRPLLEAKGFQYKGFMPRGHWFDRQSPPNSKANFHERFVINITKSGRVYWEHHKETSLTNTTQVDWIFHKKGRKFNPTYISNLSNLGKEMK